MVKVKIEVEGFTADGVVMGDDIIIKIPFLSTEAAEKTLKKFAKHE